MQTGLASKSDLTSIVTASGEIKPRNYINIGANAQGRITQLLVKEGDHVRKDQVVARIEHIQAQADVTAYKAQVSSALADSAAAEAGMKAQDDAIATAVGDGRKIQIGTGARENATRSLRTAARASTDCKTGLRH